MLTMLIFNNNNRMKNNDRDTNYFIINFINYWCDKWLLINKKIILIINLNKN